MKIAVVSTGPYWSSDLADVFGRCSYFLIFDTEADTTEALENPGVKASGGSGVEAAQLIVNQGVEVLVTPKVGPKAHKVLEAAGIRFIFQKGGTTGAALGEARREEPA